MDPTTKMDARDWKGDESLWEIPFMAGLVAMAISVVLAVIMLIKLIQLAL